MNTEDDRKKKNVYSLLEPVNYPRKYVNTCHTCKSEYMSVKFKLIFNFY